MASVPKNGGYGFGPVKGDGKGRLWERFELHDINDRLENVLLNVPVPVNIDNDKTVNDIREILKEHASKVQDYSAEWKRKLQKKSNDINKFKDEIKKKAAEINKLKRAQMLENGINGYIAKRTQKMQEKIDRANKERDNAFHQLKQEKKKHQKLFTNCQEERNKYKNERDTFEQLLGQINEQSVYDQNAAIIKDRNEIQSKYDDLESKFAAKNYKLDGLFNNKMDEILKEINSFDADKMRALWKQDLRELNTVYQDRLSRKEIEWKRAKEESIKTLDAELKSIFNTKLKLKKDELETTESELNRSKNQIKHLNDELKEREHEICRLKKKVNAIKQNKDLIQQTCEENERLLKNKNAEIMSLQTELSKYKILWQHFFGLDAGLKDGIDECKETLTKIERKHDLSPPPVPRKKRLVVVESLGDWRKFNTHKIPAPLKIDKIPRPNDVFARFSLLNYSKMSIKLKGFTLKNGDDVTIKLDESEIRSYGHIVVALKKQKKCSDILAPVKFCNFDKNDKIYLCDAIGGKELLFPTEYDIYTSLLQFASSPLGATPFELDNDTEGFIISNDTGRKITLIDHHFANQKRKLRINLPSKKIGTNETIRIIFSDNPKLPGRRPTDLIVPTCKMGKSGDELCLRDSNGNQFPLYEYSEF